MPAMSTEERVEILLDRVMKHWTHFEVLADSDPYGKQAMEHVMRINIYLGIIRRIYGNDK